MVGLHWLSDLVGLNWLGDLVGVRWLGNLGPRLHFGENSGDHVHKIGAKMLVSCCLGLKLSGAIWARDGSGVVGPGFRLLL